MKPVVKYVLLVTIAEAPAMGPAVIGSWYSRDIRRWQRRRHFNAVLFCDLNLFRFRKQITFHFDGSFEAEGVYGGVGVRQKSK